MHGRILYFEVTMTITILCTGKLKEKYFSEAVREYTKRLSRYCSIQIRELPDEPTPDNAGPQEIERIKYTEGQRQLKSVRDDDYVICLAIEGHKLTSEALSEKLSSLMLHGESHIVFVIGGSLGLSREVLSRGDYLLSFSDMTFPHQLMRVILLEQIYRSFRIMRNEPYHK